MKYPLLLLSLLFIGISCKRQEEKTTPVLENITESVYASGIVKSSNQYEVFSRVNGIADKWIVKEGDLVDKGKAILKLSGVTAQLQAENARIAAEHAAQTANSQRIAELRLNIDLAKMKLEQDAIQLERQRNLWAQQIGSRNELEQRELAWKTSRNNYDAARLRYAELKREISFGEKQALKNLEISKSQVGDYTIKSEYSGKLYDILVEEGEMVNIQQPIAVIGDASSFLLELQVDEYDIARIRPEQKIIITMDSYRGQLFQAIVTKVKPFMHERSKTFTVEAQFLQPPPVLYPNLTCEANIIVAQKENALVIPRACLLEGNYVLLASGEKRKVFTGLMDYQKVEIIKGLTVNDLILKPAP
ncbi:efflux RND transporter periplasmic adaptor subunit [Chitinophaga sp. CF418]|uniref:efflux RND transporter periplasmic adaptor subunit n=1 Tax=Chitinophaga sp. CF418 TaxID=1855287 RepID=UPI0009181002|nr:efflux RND transporter periplasmic adaptor subunit [Chitinophaga sp. CF418]SHN25152.1 Multidrug efflux pump subunit AcrA (membrane-fusion protein) [Chitinophaga sp. CF418]